MTKGSISGVGYLMSLLTPLLVVYLVVGLLVRVGLWAVFRADSRMHLSGLLTAVGIGAGNDLIEFLYLALPLTLIVALVRQRFMSRKGGAILLGVLSYVALCTFIFTAIAEVLFWEEFECRFNLIAVDYLIYPTEFVGNIKESYPIVPILSGILLVAAADLLTATLQTAYEKFTTHTY
jgi:hypothetical protein